jgi:two-component system chemotaxis sensor kinase CheA
MSPDPQDREHLLALLRSASGFAARIRDDLEESLSDTFGPIAHTVRSRVIQLAEDRGKALDVRVLGAWTPIPPGLESTIGDLLLQLARNALDHGLESAEVRKDLGKAAAGVITLGAERGERWVSLWVEDDGAGIDTARVRDAAGGDEVPEGNADDIESEDYELLMDTLTQPGFTTVDGDRHSSGRGVGLDIVRHTVETLLSGRLGLRSQSGSGTRFTLRFPVAAHTLDVIVVAVGPRRLAVPQLLIEEVRDLHPGDDTRTERGERFVALGGSYTPICETGHAAVPEEGGVGILVDGAAGRVVLIADAVVAEERVLRYRNSPYVVYSQALDRRVALLVPLHGC